MALSLAVSLSLSLYVCVCVCLSRSPSVSLNARTHVRTYVKDPTQHSKAHPIALQKRSSLNTRRKMYSTVVRTRHRHSLLIKQPTNQPTNYPSIYHLPINSPSTYRSNPADSNPPNAVETTSKPRRSNEPRRAKPPHRRPNSFAIE
jgi:hypothetical protein